MGGGGECVWLGTKNFHTHGQTAGGGNGKSQHRSMGRRGGVPTHAGSTPFFWGSSGHGEGQRVPGGSHNVLAKGIHVKKKLKKGKVGVFGGAILTVHHQGGGCGRGGEETHFKKPKKKKKKTKKTSNVPWWVGSTTIKEEVAELLKKKAGFVKRVRKGNKKGIVAKYTKTSDPGGKRVGKWDGAFKTGGQDHNFNTKGCGGERENHPPVTIGLTGGGTTGLDDEHQKKGEKRLHGGGGKKHWWKFFHGGEGGNNTEGRHGDGRKLQNTKKEGGQVNNKKPARLGVLVGGLCKSSIFHREKKKGGNNQKPVGKEKTNWVKKHGKGKRTPKRGCGPVATQKKERKQQTEKGQRPPKRKKQKVMGVQNKKGQWGDYQNWPHERKLGGGGGGGLNEKKLGQGDWVCLQVH